MEVKQKQNPATIKIIIASAISIGMIIAFSIPFGMISPLGNLLFPGDGIWDVPTEVTEYEIVKDSVLSHDVEVYRDEWGIPHIYGYGEEDLMFALGYIQAQDRMIQMDLVRRMALGRLSEIVGPGALSTDKYNILKLEEYWATKSVENLQLSEDPLYKSIYIMLLRYVDGINKYIETNQNNKPFEYQFLDVEIAPWEVVDTLVYAKYMSEYFTWNYKDMQRYENMMILGNDFYYELYGFPAPYQIPVCPNYGEYDDISVPSSEFNHPSSSSIDEIKSHVSDEAFTINPSYGSNFNNGVVSTSYSRSGASERIIVDFGNMNNSVSIIPSGERGISSSIHYSDQLEMFLRGEFHPQYFDATDTETIQDWANIETIIIFKKVGE